MNGMFGSETAWWLWCRVATSAAPHRAATWSTSLRSELNEKRCSNFPNVLNYYFYALSSFSTAWFFARPYLHVFSVTCTAFELYFIRTGKALEIIYKGEPCRGLDVSNTEFYRPDTHVPTYIVRTNCLCFPSWTPSDLMLPIHTLIFRGH